MIESLALSNFKAFDDLELPLGDLTLLSGLNGTGKSSVLQALGLLRQSFDSGALDLGEFGLNGPLVEIGTGRDLLHQGFTAPMIDIGLVLKHGDALQYLDWSLHAVSDADVLYCQARPDVGAIASQGVFGRGFQFLRADRITPAVTFPRSQRAVDHDEFLGARGEYSAHFLLKFGEDRVVPEALRLAGEDRPNLLDQVNAWMQIFSPGVRLQPEAVPMTDFVRLAYSFHGAGAAYGDALRPTNVGFGLTHVLPVIIACLAAQPGSLLVIENPEAQLHPRGQTSLGRLLALTASTGVQVIVESHSDHVLNGMRLVTKAGLLAPERARLHFFSRRPGSATAYESPALSPEGRLSFWPEGFFDQWEKSLDELLA